MHIKKLDHFPPPSFGVFQTNICLMMVKTTIQNNKQQTPPPRNISPHKKEGFNMFDPIGLATILQLSKVQLVAGVRLPSGKSGHFLQRRHAALVKIRGW